MQSNFFTDGTRIHVSSAPITTDKEVYSLVVSSDPPKPPASEKRLVSLIEENVFTTFIHDDYPDVQVKYYGAENTLWFIGMSTNFADPEHFRDVCNKITESAYSMLGLGSV